MSSVDAYCQSTVEYGYKRRNGTWYFDSYTRCDSCNQFMPNIVDSFGIIGRVISQQTLPCVQRYPYTQTMDFTQFCSGNWIQYWNGAECSCARCSHSAETACTVYMCVPENKCQSSLIWTMDCEWRTRIYYLLTLSQYKVGGCRIDDYWHSTYTGLFVYVMIHESCVPYNYSHQFIEYTHCSAYSKMIKITSVNIRPLQCNPTLLSPTLR